MNSVDACTQVQIAINDTSLFASKEGESKFDDEVIRGL